MLKEWQETFPKKLNLKLRGKNADKIRIEQKA